MTNNYTNDINSNFASAKREIEQIKTQISTIDFTNAVNSIISKINDMTVDDELSATSTKPVQNGVITTTINTIQSDITDVEDDISDLSGTVSSNYTILDTKIDTTETNLQGNIDTLSGTVTSNYNNLNSTITSSATTINSRIDSEVSTLETSINSESTIRENADNNLQSQIDAITAASDVVDIVGTYAALQAYNSSNLQNNDIVKVLSDESRDDETTYYRWIITDGVGGWYFIGEEGPYYTKSEADSQFVPQTRTINNKPLTENINLTASDLGALPADTQIGNGTILLTQGGVQKGTFTLNQTGNATIDFDAVSGNITVDSELSTSSENPVQNKVITTALNNKQGAISDLATIRSGASAGATALQPGDDISELNNDAGYITGISATDVTGALGYTPYNATNPMGYTSNVGTVTSVNNIEPVNGNVTLSIPETVTVDSELSTSSENPVQNKVITQAVNTIEDAVFTQGLNVDVAGTLNFAGTVVSGFGSNDYLITTKRLSIGAATWEVTTKITVGTTDLQYFFKPVNNISYSFLACIGSRHFGIFGSSNGSSWDIMNLRQGSKFLSTGEIYYLKFGYNGTKYYLDYSTDGVTYTNDISYTSSAHIYTDNTFSTFGRARGNSPAFDGSIDLAYTKIYVNDSLVWSGVSENIPNFYTQEEVNNLLANLDTGGTTVIFRDWSVEE